MNMRVLGLIGWCCLSIGSIGRAGATLRDFGLCECRVWPLEDRDPQFQSFSKTTDFLLDYEAGFISSDYKFLSGGGSSGGPVPVLGLLPRYSLRELPSAGSAASAAVPLRVGPAKIKPGGLSTEEFHITGQKSIGLAYSPAGESEFQQSLSLALKGKLSERVGFSANLSDRNLPSGSGELAQRLGQFDQIGFGFNFPQGDFNLGDVFFKGGGGNFLNFERKISGLALAVHTPKESLAVALGSGPGEFRTVEVAGQDGKQGPYYFASGRSFLVPGSEKVFLNGELMNSGREGDYEIDYERGSLTFSPRRTISGFSRIRVEYEFQGGPYEKNISAGRSTSALLGGNLKLHVGYLSVKDKLDSPLLKGLTPEEKAQLREAGGNSSAAVRDGAVFVGWGKGDYSAWLDSAGVRQYRYVGPNAGDYTVSFSLARGRPGDYRYLGAGAYEYAGKGLGAYLPVLYLPVPGSEAATRVGVEFGPKNFSTFAEGALSLVNKNLFSNQPAARLGGGAWVGGVRWQSSETPAVKIEARMKRRDADFQYLGTRDENETAYRWNLLPAEEDGAQTEGEISASSAWSWGRSRLDFGALALPGGRQNRLGESDFSITPWNWLTVESKSEAGRSSYQSGHYRTRNSATGRWKGWTLVSTVEREKGNPYLGPLPELHQQWSGRVGYKAGFVEALFRNRAGYRSSTPSIPSGSGWGGLSRSTQLRLGSSPLTVGGKFSAEALVGWNRTKNPGRTVERGYLLLRNNYADGGRNFNFSHEVSPVESPAEVFSYVDVGRGNGAFRLEDGRYVADPYGNFSLISDPAGDTLAVYRVRQNWEAGWEPFRRVDSTAGFWSHFSCRASLGFDGEFIHPGAAAALLPVLALNESRRHELTFRQSALWQPESRRSRWELAWQEENSKRNYLGTSLAAGTIYSGSSRSQRTLTLSSSFYGQKLTQTYTLEYAGKKSAAGFWNAFQIQGAGARSEWLFAFNRTFSASLGGRYYADREQISGRPSNLLSVHPKLIFSFPGKGRAEAGLEATRVFGQPITFEQADGNLKGLNLDYVASLEYRLGPKLAASASFLGSRRPGLASSQRASTHLSYLF